MARTAITYEQVAAVANALFAAGDKNPGTKSIREELAKRAGPGGATGSPNTIQRHLGEWRLRERPVDAPIVAPVLPAQLAADINRALNSAATVAREECEARLELVRGELADLAASGEAYESTIDELTQALAARTSERDTLAGQLDAMGTKAAELKLALDSTSERATVAERALLAAQADVMAANGRVDEIRGAAEKQVASVQAALDQVRAQLVAAEQKVIESDRRAVGAEANLTGERTTGLALDARVKDAVAELQTVRAVAQTDAARAAAAEALVGGLREQIEMLREMVKPVTQATEAS